MRTGSTVEKYRKEGLRLVRFYKRTTGNDDLGGFADWLIAQKSGWLKNTWYLYKQGALKILQDLGMESQIALLNQEGSSGCRAGRLKIRRGLPDRDLEKLQKAAVGPGSWNALVWVIAGRATGLRPSEWKNARLEEGPEGPVLVVGNAKYTNGRGNGPVRHLHFRDLLTRVQADDPEASTIWSALRNHLENVRKAKEKGSNGFEKI
ncbi:MAG: probable phage integrase [Leptospirillum rubarum]|nr:MAG: probable phage integrase [Leptospirillum rubarum]